MVLVGSFLVGGGGPSPRGGWSTKCSPRGDFLLPQKGRAPTHEVAQERPAFGLWRSWGGYSGDNFAVFSPFLGKLLRPSSGRRAERRLRGPPGAGSAASPCVSPRRTAFCGLRSTSFRQSFQPGGLCGPRPNCVAPFSVGGRDGLPPTKGVFSHPCLLP